MKKSYFHAEPFLYDLFNNFSFDCIRLEDKKPLSECLNYKFYCFPEDSTIAVKELKQNSEGKDYCPFLLRRTKIPKNSKRIANTLISSDDTEPLIDYMEPIDLQIGKEVIVLGHRFLLCDCDARTRIYYENILKAPQGDKVVIEKVKLARKKIVSSMYLVRNVT